MTTYNLVEIFRSVKGEGINTGIPMTFVRFAGCNMECPFCDTPHDTKMTMTEDRLLENLRQEWKGNRWVVITGGEPLLQITNRFIATLKCYGLKVALETNGSLWSTTLPLFNHIAVSPKGPSQVHKNWIESNTHPTEVRHLVLPNTKAGDFSGYRELWERTKWITFSPMFIGGRGRLVGAPHPAALNTAYRMVLAMTSNYHNVRLSVQVHKLIGVR